MIGLSKHDEWFLCSRASLLRCYGGGVVMKANKVGGDLERRFIMI